MDSLIVPIVVALVLIGIVFPLWALIRIVSLGRENDAIASRQLALESELRTLREALRSSAPAFPPAAAPGETPVAPAAVAVLTADPVPIDPARPAPPHLPVAPLASVPPPVIATAPVSHPAAPPVIEAPRPPPPANAAPKIDWERFTGAKLFAWIGGVAGFLAAAFFVKHAFERDLIPPEIRVALGFLFALGLVIGGLRIDRRRYGITAQTLCATGIVSLYAVTFSCNSIYHFAFFGPLATFLVMALITGVAFLLAVRLDAKVVAVLGMLGGFLTPVLLSTGRDNAPSLFGYIALLDVGLLAVALHQRWHVLAALGAAATVAMQIGWAGKFLHAAKAPTAMVVCLGFCALFLAAHQLARRLGRGAPELRWSAIAFPLVAFGFAFVFLFYPGVAARPGLLFTFVLLADVCLLAMAWLDDEAAKLHLVAGVAVFALLAAWTGSALTAALLPWALAFYLLHAILHTAFPQLLERHRPTAAPTWWSQLFPPLALLLMMVPLFRLEALSLLFWPCVLLVDLIAIALALATGSLAAVGIVLVLTLIVTGVWIFRVPVTVGVAPSLLLVVGGFAILFFAAGLLLARKFGPRLADGSESLNGVLGDARAQIPAFSALLPFLLLVLMTQRLPLTNPSPVFGLALLLVGLTLGLARGLVIAWLPACALAGVAALEYSWAEHHPDAGSAALPLAWHLGFHAVFAVFPFLFRARFAAQTGPWAVAALSGVLHFPLVYRLVQRAWPNDFIGLLPALFALPPLVSLVIILRFPAAGARARLNQLAWFGGVALLFVTLIFPIQFERQWLTLGWALEGVALLWLFHRVPHPGLRATGVALLGAAFARLALNPAVFAYQVRGDTALLNWYLYSYGIAIACLFAGARLLSAPDPGGGRILGVDAAAVLRACGTILAFLLLNLEIADFFSAPGRRVLTFQFSGHFARDMTYTIAWSLFAFCLLLVGIWRRTRIGRYAALALLGVAVLKLFFHDLARLQALYRIGALFAVAVIAILASFAYQRFLPGNRDTEAPPKAP